MYAQGVTQQGTCAVDDDQSIGPYDKESIELELAAASLERDYIYGVLGRGALGATFMARSAPVCIFSCYLLVCKEMLSADYSHVLDLQYFLRCHLRLHLPLSKTARMYVGCRAGSKWR